MLNIFSRWPQARRCRYARRSGAARAAGSPPPAPRPAAPAPGIALPQARRLYPRLGRQQAMLLLWIVISAALPAVALVLNTSGHKRLLHPVGGNGVPSPPSRSMPMRPTR
jgi:hypothetical protein